MRRRNEGQVPDRITHSVGTAPVGDRWTGGQIVDPDNGKTYRCEIVVEDSGNKLKVRGYVGFSLFGRTEYWLRER